MAVDLLIHSIGELATPHLENVPAHGSAMGKINRIKNAAVAIADGKLSLADLKRKYWQNAVSPSQLRKLMLKADWLHLVWLIRTRI